VLAPSFGMSGNATTSSSVLVPLARTVAAASDDAPDDEAPPWAAAPWDDYGAAAFLDSAQQDTPRTKPGIDAPVTAVPVNKPDSVAAPSPAPVVELPPGMRLTALGCDEDWPTFAAALDVKGLAQQVALQSELIETNEIDASRGMLRLRIPVAQLASGAHVDKVIAAIGERVGRTVELHIEVGPVRVTAAAVDAARKAQAQRLAEAAIQSDPFVQALLREFDASIMPGSTQAISGHAAG
jgi:DNA polymerase-3 subunit gamma/tau